MDEPYNPEKLRLQEITEKTTGNKFYEVEQADGGRIQCPLTFNNQREVRNCKSSCAWFYTHCAIPQKLGLTLA